MHAACRYLAGTPLAVLALLAACGSGDRIVGDDSAPDASETDAPVDAAPPPDAPDADAAPDSGGDSAPDAPPGSCAAAGGACQATGAACRQLDTSGIVCAGSGQVCCLVTCPELTPLPPGFCDGGPTAELYDSHECIVGYACAPVSCTTAGGSCVGLSPTACPAPRHFGDANTYSCGGGLGVACCLP